MKALRTPLLCALVLCGGCLKPSPKWSTYNIPATYSFLNVNDSAQLLLLTLTDQLIAKADSANTMGVPVSAQSLAALFGNKLFAVCSPAAKADLLSYFDSVAVYSQSAVAGVPGTAGVSGGYLLSPGGTYFGALVKTSLITGLIAYKLEGNLSDSLGDDVNNINITPGWGSSMEHVWDEAFGLFGVPKDFPTDTLHLRYLGYYSNLVDSGLHANSALMTAFLTGRAAISSDDMGTRQTQAGTISATLEQLEAASAIHALNTGGANPAALSEALGFLKGLSYDTYPGRLITDAQITQAEAFFTTGNMYAAVDAGGLRQLLGSIYGFTAAQMAAF